jgi:hypothetical protein
MDEEQENCQALAVAIPSWTNDIITSYLGDETSTKLLQEVTIDPNSHAHYSVQSGILRYKERLYIGASTDLRQKVFDSFHSSVFGGHSGTRVTYHKLKHIFYCPKMKQYVSDQIAACPICQISKTEKIQYPGPWILSIFPRRNALKLV